MNRQTISILLVATGCLLAAVDAFPQEIVRLESLQNRQKVLPRYNFWVEGTLMAIKNLTILKAPDTEYSYKASEWQVSASAERFLGRWNAFRKAAFSFYLGGRLGYRHLSYMDSDQLTLKSIHIDPGYAQAGIYASIQFTPFRELKPWFELQGGYLLDALVTARIDSDAKQLTGYNRDCLTPLVNSFFVGINGFIDRVRLGVSFNFRMNPPLSVTELEYYKGTEHSLGWNNLELGFTLAILLGGTDK